MELLIITIISVFVTSIYIFHDTPKKKKVKRVDRNDRYKMPPIFWDEFNWLSLKIYHMKIDETDVVQARINEFIYKYEQFVDFQVFNDRVGILLSDYQKKVSSLLNNKHLEHGTSV
jgi:hypothetical protein